MTFRYDRNDREKQDIVDAKKRSKDSWEIFQALTATTSTPATSSTAVPQLNRTVNTPPRFTQPTNTNNTPPRFTQPINTPPRFTPPILHDPVTDITLRTLERIDRVITLHFEGISTFKTIGEIESLEIQIDNLIVGPRGTRSRELRRKILNAIDVIHRQLINN